MSKSLYNNRGLRVGAPVELRSYDHDGNEHWLKCRVRARVSNGYRVSAPWTVDGSTFIKNSDRGRTWRGTGR